MRKSIPPELDDLMWTLAESGNDQAIDEFGDRYPQYRGALTKRIETVRGLKGAKKPLEPKPVAARFVPKEKIAPDTSRWAMNVAIALGLLAVAAISFLVTALLNPEPKPEPSVETPAPVHSTVSEPKTSTPEPKLPASVPVVPEATDAKSDLASTKRISLSIKGAQLKTIFLLIEKESKIRVIAPDSMQDATVDAVYKDMSPMEILTLMGEAFNFTALDQHDGSIVIIPVKPGTRGPETGSPKDNRRRIGG